MRKLLSLSFVILAVALQPAYAQQTAIKIAPFQLFGLDLKAQGERAITDHLSVQLEVIYAKTNADGGTFTAALDNFNNQQTSTTTYTFTDGGTSRLAITPEIRFYTGQQALKGFYLGVFPRFSSNTADLSFDYLEEGASVASPASGEYKLNMLGAGGNMGVQWLIGDHFVIDWTILGLGYMRGKLELSTTSPTFDAQDLADIEAGLNNIQEVGLLRRVDFTAVDQTATVKGPVGFPLLRTGLLIGFAF